MTMTCTNCGQPYPPTELTELDGCFLCGHCLETETSVCSHCGRRIWNECDVGEGVPVLCQSCRDELYTTCDVCGSPVAWESAHYEDDDPEEDAPLCWVCYNRRQANNQIHEYSYKPAPIFYGEGERYFGVELELDHGGEDSGNACAIMGRANLDRELIYCKHDGSLDSGFEIVTHPMTLNFHQSSMPWPEVLEEAVALGYRSHQARTCGLHVHVNRTAFGDTEIQQELAIARVLYLVEKFWDELLKFSRRTQSQLDRWAARYGYKEHPMQILDRAKERYGRGRYFAVNLLNRNTIEFRLFRGTLKYNTLIATLQLVNKICEVAVNLSDEPLKALAWTTFVSGIQELELVQYLKERRLYVNEPVEEGEEL